MPLAVAARASVGFHSDCHVGTQPELVELEDRLVAQVRKGTCGQGGASHSD